MPLSKKTIRDKTPEDLVEMIYGVTRWLDAYNESGEDIYGKDYQLVTAIIGIALMGQAESVNSFFEKAEAMADSIRKKNSNPTDDLLRGFGINLEGDDIKPN